MADLAKGYTIQTINFQKVVVGDKLGEGGQGAVYRVDYGGKPKALKWYSKKLSNPDKFYKNLENNIKKGKPTEAFLWPEDITQKDGEAFGYIMDLRKAEYVDFTKILLGKKKEYAFASITAMCNACLQIIEGFRELHRKGYSYQDLNDGNFFINPQNGDVLICDNDNVSEAGQNSGIAGKARYMAPEIVAKGNCQTNIQTVFRLRWYYFCFGQKIIPWKAKLDSLCVWMQNRRKKYSEKIQFLSLTQMTIPTDLYKGLIRVQSLTGHFCQLTCRSNSKRHSAKKLCTTQAKGL